MLTPRENPNWVGQREAEQTLLTAIGGGRLPHAWLFLGPKGVGKATLAFRFARFLLANGLAPGGADDGGGLFGDALPAAVPTFLAIDPEHPTFRRVAAKGHTDLMVLDADLATGRSAQIPADAVRGLGPFLHQTAGEGGRRIVIVDALDELNPTGANALLKLVEEPPAGAVVLLIAHSMARVLPTIRSRCRVLRLSGLSPAEVEEVLAMQLPQEDEAIRSEAALLSGGSPGKALAMLASDGIAIHQAVQVFWQNRSAVSRDAIVALAQLSGRDAAHFAHFSEAFCRGFVGLARNRGGGREWDEFWSETLRIFDRTEAVYLDRQQVVLNRIQAAAKLA